MRSKKKYSLAYLRIEYDGSDLTYFLSYNLSCIEQAIRNLLVYLESQQARIPTEHALLRQISDINPRQVKVLNDMREHPREYYTIRQVMQMYDVVYQAARTDLLHLAEQGYVAMEKRGKAFLFVFDDRSRTWGGSHHQNGK